MLMSRKVKQNLLMHTNFFLFSKKIGKVVELSL